MTPSGAQVGDHWVIVTPELGVASSVHEATESQPFSLCFSGNSRMDWHVSRVQG